MKTRISLKIKSGVEKPQVEQPYSTRYIATAATKVSGHKTSFGPSQ